MRLTAAHDITRPHHNQRSISCHCARPHGRHVRPHRFALAPQYRGFLLAMPHFSVSTCVIVGPPSPTKPLPSKKADTVGESTGSMNEIFAHALGSMSTATFATLKGITPTGGLGKLPWQIWSMVAVPCCISPPYVWAEKHRQKSSRPVLLPLTSSQRSGGAPVGLRSSLNTCSSTCQGQYPSLTFALLPGVSFNEQTLCAVGEASGATSPVARHKSGATRELWTVLRVPPDQDAK